MEVPGIKRALFSLILLGVDFQSQSAFLGFLLPNCNIRGLDLMFSRVFPLLGFFDLSRSVSVSRIQGPVNPWKRQLLCGCWQVLICKANTAQKS
jgi:hypothetical protein